MHGFEVAKSNSNIFLTISLSHPEAEEGFKG
jgi:hypothetical protein